MNSILSANQRQILDALSDESAITNAFYLTGGTALAEYYLHHRYSEDLDFFCDKQFDPGSITAVLKKIAPRVGITATRYEQSFNRNLFFLETDSELIKTEFTFFPFVRIETGKKDGALEIDSLMDIAVNKLFTIFQKPRARDFIDLYCILRKEPLTVADLSQKAQIKFDMYIDPLQLGAQFVRAEELKDYPRMILALKPEDWQEFFLKEAKNLRPQVLE